MRLPRRWFWQQRYSSLITLNSSIQPPQSFLASQPSEPPNPSILPNPPAPPSTPEPPSLDWDSLASLIRAGKLHDAVALFQSSTSTSSPSSPPRRTTSSTHSQDPFKTSTLIRASLLLLQTARDAGDAAAALKIVERLDQTLRQLSQMVGSSSNATSTSSASSGIGAIVALARALAVATSVHATVLKSVKDESEWYRRTQQKIKVLERYESISAAADAIGDNLKKLVQLKDRLTQWKVRVPSSSIAADKPQSLGEPRLVTISLADSQGSLLDGTGASDASIVVEIAEDVAEVMGRARMVLADRFLNLAAQVRLFETMETHKEELSEKLKSLRLSASDAALEVLDSLRSTGPNANTGGVAPAEFPAVDSFILKANVFRENLPAVAELLEFKADSLDFTVWAEAIVCVASETGLPPVEADFDGQTYYRGRLNFAPKEETGSGYAPSMSTEAAQNVTLKQIQLLGASFDALIKSLRTSLDARSLLLWEQARAERTSSSVESESELFAATTSSAAANTESTDAEKAAERRNIDIRKTYSSVRLALVRNAITATMAVVKGY
ncbi:hypothetical protein DFJ73DRAFT_770059 [Zopfochytrium polystomum]|nr:hypothetical protein DFJ73DRAFT_770059 [Zopfochytrium polystomum]